MVPADAERQRWEAQKYLLWRPNLAARGKTNLLRGADTLPFSDQLSALMDKLTAPGDRPVGGI